MSRRRFTREFKQAAIRKLRRGLPTGEVARACRVDPAILHRWQKESDEFGTQAFGGYGKNRHIRAEPRSRAISLYVSPDELDALKTAATSAGFRSLAEFARFRIFHASDVSPRQQVETLLASLAVVLRKLTYTLQRE